MAGSVSRRRTTSRRRNAWDGAPFWVFKAGLRPSRILPKDDSKPFALESDQTVKITLEPPVSSTFRLLDLEGTPVAGCKVAVVFLNDGRSTLPDELSDRLAEITNAAGRVVLHVASPDSIRILRTTSSAFGTQGFYSDDTGFKPGADLKLTPVASIEGRIKADDPNAVRGVLVHLNTRYGDWGQLTGQGESVVRLR